MIDADRIAQCLLNIDLNALQAMKRDGIMTLRCETDHNSHVRITVSDTGPRIPAEQLNKIFNPYFPTKSMVTGLGLAIIHKIAQAHKVRLKVESAPGKGTVFTLRFACLPTPKEKRTL